MLLSSMRWTLPCWKWIGLCEKIHEGIFTRTWDFILDWASPHHSPATLLLFNQPLRLWNNLCESYNYTFHTTQHISFCILLLNSELLNKTHSFCGFVLSASRGASKCSIYTFSALALLIVFNALEQPCYTCSIQGQASSTFVLKELWDVLIHNPVYTSCEREIYVMYAA